MMLPGFTFWGDVLLDFFPFYSSDVAMIEVNFAQ